MSEAFEVLGYFAATACLKFTADGVPPDIGPRADPQRRALDLRQRKRGAPEVLFKTLHVTESAMNVPGVAAFEHTIQETNIWLKMLAEQLHLDGRHHAYNALRAVLHALRDRLTPEMAVHLGAQLPMLVRGLYYEGWHMAGKPTKDRNAQEFADHVLAQLPPQFPMDPLTVTKGVFRLLWQKLDPGESAKVIEHLPLPLRALWP